ncbi:hypothetical protein H0H93_004246 [Arthromyces matolae]|nr:hypothetical protein H0H93_004246 [Arthromyces matolae]
MKTSVLVDIERELDMVAGMDMVMMDVDGRNIDVSPSIDSVDMDIDVEAPHLKPKSILSSPPRRSPPLAPAAPDCVLSPHQLVAALILRNRTTRKSSSTRPSAGSERIRRRSPLADSAI